MLAVSIEASGIAAAGMIHYEMHAAVKILVQMLVVAAAVCRSSVNASWSRNDKVSEFLRIDDLQLTERKHFIILQIIQYHGLGIIETFSIALQIIGKKQIS